MLANEGLVARGLEGMEDDEETSAEDVLEELAPPDEPVVEREDTDAIAMSYRLAVPGAERAEPSQYRRSPSASSARAQ